MAAARRAYAVPHPTELTITSAECPAKRVAPALPRGLFGSGNRCDCAIVSPTMPSVSSTTLSTIAIQGSLTCPRWCGPPPPQTALLCRQVAVDHRVTFKFIESVLWFFDGLESSMTCAKMSPLFVWRRATTSSAAIAGEALIRDGCWLSICGSTRSVVHQLFIPRRARLAKRDDCANAR